MQSKVQQFNTIGGRFVLGRKISEGSHGAVYVAADISNGGNTVALKTESWSLDKSSIDHEANIYWKLRNNVAVPQYIQDGSDLKYGKYLVTDLLGPSLEQLFMVCGQKFSLETTLLIFA